MKVIFTTGAFDLLHKNHIKFLKKCKEYGNYLIVGLCSDKLLKSYKREPILSYCQRYKMLNELSFIDKIIKIDLFTKNIPIKFYIENKIDYQVQINSDKVKYYNRKDIKFIFINPSYGLHTTNIINKIQNKITKVCLVGGTSTTHYLASILGEKPDFKVNILTRNPSKWSTTINCLDKSDYIIATGIINKISDDPKEVIPDSNIIIISVPSFCLEDIVKKISPYITENTIIGKLPGTGGFDWIIKKYITTKNITFFGTQRLPFVVRKINYGHSCLVYGHKKKIPFCCIPNSESDNVKKILNEIFTYDCIPLDNYLNITLVPSNPILHTSRFYSLFKNWTNNVKYDKPIKFYEEWDDISYENLKGCDNEVQKICNSLPNMENVLSLEKSYIYNYGDNIKDTTNLLTMIKSNKAYAGILTPMKKIDNTYIPDFESRYLTEDIPFGLVILKAIALILDIKTPYFDKILLWGQNIINKEYLVDNKLIGKNINEIIIPQHFNIKNKNDLINFNKNELNKYNKLLILCTNSDPNKTRPIGQIRNKDTFNFPTKLEILKNVSLSNLFKKKKYYKQLL